MKSIRDILEKDQSAEAFTEARAIWDSPYSLSVGALMMGWHAALRSNGPILDAGTGLSTIVLAMAAQRMGAHVHAVETSHEWMEHTRAAAADADLDNITFHVLTRLDEEPLRLFALHTPDEFAMASIDASLDLDVRLMLFGAVREKLRRAYVLFDDVYSKETAEPLRAFAAECWRNMALIGGAPNFAVLTPRKAKSSS